MTPPTQSSEWKDLDEFLYWDCQVHFQPTRRAILAKFQEIYALGYKDALYDSGYGAAPFGKVPSVEKRLAELNSPRPKADRE